MFGVRPATVYDEARKLQVFRSLIEGLASVPGVKAVGANTTRLLTGGRWDSSITIPGVTAKDGNHPWSFFNAITPGYFEALGIPINGGARSELERLGQLPATCAWSTRPWSTNTLGGRNPVGRCIGQGG